MNIRLKHSVYRNKNVEVVTNEAIVRRELSAVYNRFNINLLRIQ